MTAKQHMHAGRRSALRLVVGLVISAGFLAILFSRVDPVAVAREIVRANPVVLVVALGLVWLEIAIRAERWRWLLRPHTDVPYAAAVSYLCIGYFANSMLPARLGDAARAYLAGRSFGISRLTTLGTILVERVGDGLWMVVTALAAMTAVMTVATLQASALWVLIVGLIGAFAIALAWRAISMPRFRSTSVGRLAVEAGTKLLRGALALRSPAGALRFVVATAAAWLTAVGVLSLTTASVGVELTILQAALATSGVALSLSIPAGPNALGTYELVGTAILVSLGVAPEPALAAIALTHLIVSIPPALAGLVMTWVLHIRLEEIDAGGPTGPQSTRYPHDAALGVRDDA